MSYNKKDVITAISIMIFIITFAITFTVFFKPLYYSDVYRLGIDISSGIDIDTIKDNYDILIQYQSIFYRGSLELPDFVMSTGGRIHFEEVKRIFEVIQMLLIVSSISSVICIYQRWKQKEYRFLRLSSILTIVIPSIVGVIAMVNFNQAFIIFHKLFFRNDYWVFDARTDPIISILPQTFFMHCFLMIIGIVLLLSGGCYLVYRRKQKQILFNNR
ncbi:MAG: TIGR01906 family membrane protein [Coprobacillaceae bacterium]